MDDSKLPIIKLKLDHPGLPYRPGDTLTGFVKVSDAPVQKKKTTGGLLGRLKASGSQDVPGDDCTVANLEGLTIEVTGYATTLFFLRHEEMRSNPVILLCTEVRIKPNSSGEWRFQFEIPRTTDPTFSPSHAAQFATEREHPLPPSVPVLNGLNSAGSGLCAKIEYSLEPVSLKFRTSEKVVPIFQMESSKTFWVTSNYPTEATMDKLNAEQASCQDTFTLKGRKLVKGLNVTPKRTPSITCKTTFSGPSFVHVGSDYILDIGVHIAHTSVPELTAAHIPLSLASLSVTLQKQWAIYSTPVKPRLSNAYFASGLIPKEQPLAFEGGANGYTSQQVRVELKVRKPNLFPDFTTSYFYATYSIKFVATFDCAGEKKQQTATIPIKVLPRPRLATDKGETVGFVEGPQDLKENWGAPSRSEEGGDLLEAAGVVLNVGDAVQGAASACTIM